MATPQNINRNIGSVSPNTYVQQGVVDNSLSTAIEGVTAGALEVDKQIQTSRLDKELENLRTEYLTSSPLSKAVQDGTALSTEDAAEVARFSDDLARGKVAAEQGRNITFDSYRIRGETLLRTAIARRPGLAEHFRGVAANTLGTDVVGASVLFLAEQERAAANAAKKDQRDEKRARDQLDAVGIENAGMTAEQVYAVNAQPEVAAAVQEQLVLRSKVATGQNVLALRDQGVALNRQANYVLAEGELAAKSVELHKGAVQLERILFSQEQKPTPEQISEGITNFKLTIQGVMNQTRAGLVGSLPDGDIDKLLAGYQTVFDQLDKVASGGQLAEGAEMKVKSLLGLLKMGVMNDPNVANMALVGDLYGPEVMTQLMASNSVINDSQAQAVISVMTDEGQDAIVAATNAASVTSMFAEGLANQTPEQRVNTAASIARLPERFLHVPDDKYNYGAYGAFIDKLALHRKSIARDVAPDQQLAIVDGLVKSTAQYTANIGKNIDSHPQYASLRGRVDVGLQENGNVVSMQAGQTYTAQERKFIDGFNNQYRVGSQFLSIAQELGKLSPADAAKLVREAARVAPKPAPTAVPGAVEVSLGDGSPTQINQEGYEQWSSIASAKAEQYGIPASVLNNIITQESRWHTGAKSPTGVRGLAQVTRATASRFGHDSNTYTEPQNQLDAAAQYLAYLAKRYKGDYNLAVTAYNAGEGALDTYLKTGERTGNLARGGALAGSGSSQAETYAKKVMGFEEDLLTYGRGVMGISDPDDRTAMASEASKERG